MSAIYFEFNIINPETEITTEIKTDMKMMLKIKMENNTKKFSKIEIQQKLL